MEKENKVLLLIPKFERYMQYILEMLIKLPRIEKYSIGTIFKSSVYKTMEYILYVDKISKEGKLDYINKIDAELMLQRILLRIMQKERWIDNKKFNVSMEMMYELGKLVGGLTKYYGKNYKKSV